MGTIKNVILDLWKIKRTLLVIIVPFLLIPIPFVLEGSEGRCLYGLALMGIYWISESLPLAATALLPVAIFPTLGVQKATDVAGNYIKDSSMFGIGGLTIAIAVEKWNLHKRIALKALMLFGSEPKWLMLGFMLPTWFLSMWVSNTATTAMMIPIVGAVMRQLHEVNHASGNDVEMSSSDVNEKYTPLDKENGIMKDHGYSGDLKNGTVNGGFEYPTEVLQEKEIDIDVKLEDKKEEGEEEKKDKMSSSIEESPEYIRMCKGMALCVAYAANVGGTGSMSGTGPNIIMAGQADLLFQQYGMESSGVNFASWMVFALPGSFICLILTWLWLSFFFLGIKEVFRCKRAKSADDKVRNTIKKSYKELGPMSFAEIAVLSHFVILILLWFFRKPPYIDGWGSLFKDGYVGDSAAAILIVTSLFTFPSERPSVLCFRKSEDSRARGSVSAILDWPSVQRKFPWGVLLLIGGGFALADACEVSGLSRLIGEQLEVFKSLQPSVMVLILTLIIAMCTEITSNTATSTLLLPILGNLAIRLGMNPLYLMFPCAIAVSFAFMLPVATPPNAIVFATGYLTVKDMATAGLFMNIICVGVLALATNTWGMAFFKLNELPPGFNLTVQTNSTL
ncbi:hypothetical protein FSP39_024304 [Pinctada imbricata]|uniref:Uncharacterized protein n=1 Tax=Pinctada imbricata TaxID=66713 RepID=A0AA88YG77_PINIB|nr:hypothetical protein FSP39_024304 [Pinctada imbricata]